MDTPVLLAVFNRPGQTGSAIDRLRAVRPGKLYLAAVRCATPSPAAMPGVMR